MSACAGSSQSVPHSSSVRIEGALSRREFLARAARSSSASRWPRALGAQPQEPQNVGKEPKQAPPLPGSLKNGPPLLDSWIRIDADGTITVFSGKAELGQGIKTALIQVAAEELAVEPRTINLVTADTSRTPNEGYTAGSQSMSDGATAIQHAAAQVRAILAGIAAQRLNVPLSDLTVHLGAVRAKDGRSLRFGELVTGEALHVQAAPQSPLRDPKTRGVMGKSLPRVDIPSKVAGRPSYVHDLRLPNMVHARVVRPPGYGARLQTVDTSSAEKMPGVLKIVRNGSFLAVVAEREYQAIVAMRALARSGQWSESRELPRAADAYDHFQKLPQEVYVDAGGAADIATGAGHDQRHVPPSVSDACVHRSFVCRRARRAGHAHGLVAYPGGLSAAQCDCGDAAHASGAHPLHSHGRVGLLRPQRRRRRSRRRRAHRNRVPRTAGARAMDARGRAHVGAVRVHDDRDRARALDGPNVTEWQYEVWSNTHNARPGPAGNLSTAWQIDTPFTPPPPKPAPLPAGGGNRNAIPIYSFQNTRVVHHFVPEMPLRVSALRGLGAYANVFAIESFMDELAAAARIDPLDFRLRHLDDARARDVINAVAERFDWGRFQKQRGRGRGFAFARYKNYAAYCAVAIEVEADRELGLVKPIRVVAAIDSGEAVNPDGIRNQTEGGVIQSLSWTLYEAVTFESRRITSRDWSTYPIMRFSNVPDTLEVHVITRPGMPFLGTGEAAQGPTAAAVANAIADAIGVRVRELPITRAHIKAAI